MNNVHRKSLASLASGASYGFLFGIIGYVLMFVFRIVVAKGLGSDQYGLFSLAETIMKIALVFIVIGIPQGIPRYIPLYLEKKKIPELRGYLNFVFKFPLLFSLVISSLLALSANAITAFFGFSNELTSLIYVVAIILPFKTLINIIRKIFVAKKKITYFEMTYNVIEKGITLIAGIIVIIFDLSIYFLLVGVCIAILCSLLYALHKLICNIHFPKSKRKIYDTKSWLMFSLPLFFTNVFAYIINWSDNLVISKILTSSDLGIYAIAFSVALLMSFFQQIFSVIFMPLISEARAKNDEERVSFLFKKSAAWVFGLTLPVFLFFVIYARKILLVLFGGEYVAGAAALSVLSVGVFLNITTGLGSPVLMLHKRTDYLFKVNLILAIINVALNIVLVFIYGLIGAAFASAFSIALSNGIFLIKAKQYEKLSFDIPYSLKFLISGVIAIGISLFIPKLQNDIAYLIITGMAFLTVFSVLLIIFKTFKEEDIEMISLVEQKLKLNLTWLKKLLRN